MPLTKQFYEIQFGQGLDTKTDSKILSDGRMTALQNAQFINTNRLSKRNGFEALGVPDASGNFITTLDSFTDYPIGIGNPASSITQIKSLFSYNESLTTPVFAANLPIFSDCNATAEIITQNSYAQYQGDVGYVNGYICYAYCDNRLSLQRVYYKIIEEATGRIVVPETQIDSGVVGVIRIATLADAFLIGHYTQSFSRIVITTINTGANFAGQTIDIDANLPTGSGQWDWISNNTGLTTTSSVVMGYQQSNTVAFFSKLAFQTPSFITGVAGASYTASTTITNLGFVQPYSTSSTQYRSLIVGSTGSITLLPMSTSLTLYASGVISGYVNGKPLNISGQEMSNYTSGVFYTSNLVESVALVNTIANGTVSYTPANFQQSSINQFTFSQTTITSYANDVGSYQYNLIATSKPYYVNDNNIYFWTKYESSTQCQAILLKLSNSYNLALPTSAAKVNISNPITPVARIGAGELWSQIPAGPVISSISMNIFGSYGVLGNFTPTVNNQVITPTLFESTSLPIGISVTASNPSFGVITSNFNPTYSSISLNNQKIFAAGMNMLYDGTSFSELGFLIAPENIVATSLSTGGSLGIGTYQYVVLYEWSDSNGNLYVSEPSAPITVTTSTTTSSVELVIPYLNVTLKTGILNTAQYAAIVVYRDSVNASPQIFQQIAPGTLNISGQLTTTITDTISDANLASKQLLYTTGGVNPNFTIDGTNVICAGPDRLFASSPTNNGLIQVGIPYVQTNGLSFFAGITQLIPVTQADGPITGMCMLDSNLIVFYARNIWACQGLGPVATGANNLLTPFSLVTNQIGCIGPNSFCSFPDGIIFQSEKGFYKLDHGLGFAPDTHYIGKEVEAFNNLSCLRAINVTDLNKCRFAMSDYQTILEYDYFFHQWGTTITSVNDMVNVDGNFYLASHTPSIGALVAKETIGQYTDALTSITTIPYLIQTGWIGLNALQGATNIYRLRILGDYLSSHTITVNCAYDYQVNTDGTPNFTETHVLTSANIISDDSAGNPTAYQFDIFPQGTVKHESVMLQIVDSNIMGASADFTSILIQIGYNPGTKYAIANAKTG